MIRTLADITFTPTTIRYTDSSSRDVRTREEPRARLFAELEGQPGDDGARRRHGWRCAILRWRT